MKRIVSLIGLITYIFISECAGQVYVADSARVSFFSKTKAENIDAVNTLSKPVLNTSTGEFNVSLINTAFDFVKPLMKEHFNDSYMESDTYPKTSFTGKINDTVNYKADGVYKVTVTGTMDMHGVKKVITVPGVITIKGGVVFIYSKFNIKITDYNIKQPSFLGIDVADSVDVTVTATMKPYVPGK
ncbi:MAG: YceI family protein [Bacteroidia bacterium]